MFVAVTGWGNGKKKTDSEQRCSLEEARALSHPEDQEGEGGGQPALQCPLQTEHNTVLWSMGSLLVGVILMPASLVAAVRMLTKGRV